MSKASDKIGEASEIVARTACERLRESGKIMDYISVDTHGIDFLIITPHWQALPLQIKSSTCGIKWHREKYPFIAAIAVRHQSVEIGKKRKKRLAKTVALHILRLLASKKFTISFIVFMLVLSRAFQNRYYA